MNLWTYSARESTRRPGRTLMTLLGIALGVAAVVATRLAIPTVTRAYRELFESIDGQLSLDVTASGQSGFDPALVGDLASAPGVAAVVPRILGAASVVNRQGGVGVPVIGLDPKDLAAVSAERLRDGTVPHAEEDVLMDAGLAQALGLRPGDRFRLWAAAGLADFRLAGTLRPLGPGSGQGGTLLLSLGRAQRLFALAGQVNSVDVILAEGAEPDAVRATVARRLPPGLAVQSPGARGEFARTTLLATEQALTALGALALTAAAFVILNTFLLNLSERRKQLATLRTLGATRAQVRRLLLRETLLLALGGTVAGCGGGVVLAVLLLRVMGQFLGVPLPGLRLDAGPFVLAALLGPGVAVAAAWLPAWSGSRRQLLDDLLPRRSGPGDQLPRRVCQAGLLLFAVGVSLAAVVCRRWFGVVAGQALLVPALALLLIGSVLVLPAATAPLLRLASAFPLGLAANLAAGQLARQRTRTGLTAGVLFLALAVAIGFGHCLRGILRDLRHWYRQTIVADFLVRGSMPDTAFVLAAAVPESLAGEIATLAPVAAVDRFAFLPVRAGGQPALVLARDFAADRPLPLALQDGDADTVLQGLLHGEAVLGTGAAQRLGLGRGDLLTLDTPAGPQQLRVAGTATEYAGGGSALYLEWQTARRLLAVPGAHLFLVTARPGAVAELARVLEGFCQKHSLMLQSNAELRRTVEGLLGRVSGVLWALMALVFLVAALGVVNTLTMNTHDQRRDFGVLRALGLKRAQVGGVVFAQALLLGVIGLLPGAIAGVGLAYVINRGTALVGSPIPFQVDIPVVAVGCALGLGIALLAALLPARHSARQPVLHALLEA